MVMSELEQETKGEAAELFLGSATHIFSKKIKS